MSIIRALTVPTVLALTIACGGNDRGGEVTDASTPRSTNPATTAQQPDNTPDGMGARRGGTADQAFVRKAMAGSVAEIQLAQLAQQKATAAGVKSLAQRIQQDHQKASQDLQALAQQQNVGTSGADPDTMEDGHEAMQKLQTLSGAEFDRAYVDLMVEEHDDDIEAFEEAARDTTGAVQQFAQKTLPVLKEHRQLAEAQQKAVKR
jgi:putative membrane protein